MEKVREKNTAWTALMRDFVGMEQKDEENNDYRKWMLENSSEIKKSANFVKGLEKMFERVSRKRKAKETRNIDEIKSLNVQREKAKTRKEQKGEREI